MSLESADATRRAPRVALIVSAAGLLAMGLVAGSRVGATEAEAVAKAAAGAVEARDPAGPEFWAHWGDGKAELAGYRLTQPRYGELREGTAVYIYVTEPFSWSSRIKADPGRHPEDDVFQVLKLNAVKDFQTGIYDYNLMSSVFVPVAPHPKVRVGHATKLAFSSQEWCGMLFERLELDPDVVRQARFSYFDGEGESEDELPHPKGGLLVDEMPIYVRGLLGAPLERGEARTIPVLPSVERARLLHRELAWTTATLGRGAEPEALEVPAGRYQVDAYSLELAGGDRYRYWVEVEAPHRLVAWKGPGGEEGRLTGVTRLPYWQLNDEGHEKHLEALGLAPPARD